MNVTDLVRRARKGLSVFFDGVALKFALVGVANTVAGALVVFGLYNGAGLSYWWSSALAYATVGPAAYWAARRFAFSSRNRAGGDTVRYLANLAACYLAAFGLAKPAVLALARNGSPAVRDNLALGVGMAFFTVLNYLGQRFFVFRTRAPAPPTERNRLVARARKNEPEKKNSGAPAPDAALPDGSAIPEAPVPSSALPPAPVPLSAPGGNPPGSPFPTKAAYALWGAVTALFAAWMMLDANWTLGDDHLFLNTLGRGLPIRWATMIIPSIGRFAPLQLQEYGIFRLFEPTPYDAALPSRVALVNMAVFLGTALALFGLLADTVRSADPRSRAAGGFLAAVLFYALYLIHPYVLFNYGHLIMTGERLVPLFLALFLWSLHRALRDDRLLHFLAAGAAAAGMTYSKEVAVAIPTLFAVLMLVFGRKKLSRRAWTFCLFLLANAVVFVALYYFFAYRHMRSSYTAGRTSLTLWEILKSMFFAADLYAAAAALGAWRLYRLVVRGDRKHLFMDACLFSGLAYLLAYAVLKLPAPRYYTPALVAVIPALLYWAVASARFGRWVPATVSALFFAFFAYHHAPAAERQAKAVIQARRGDMAEVERLAADVRGGATVYYYQFQDLLHAEHQSTSVSYHYTVVQYFVNYALGRKFNDTTVLPLMLTTERIADDARVLFGMDRGRRDVELKRALEKFRLVDRGPVGSYRLLLATPRERNALPLVLRFAEDQSFHASGMQVFVKGSPRWTTDENAVVGLMFDPGRPVPSKLTVKTGAFLTKDAPEKTVEIFVNDISAGKWTLSFAANDHHQTKEHTLALPPGLMAPDGTFDIRFHIRPTPSPVSVGYNPDPRPLGLSLVELRLE